MGTYITNHRVCWSSLARYPAVQVQLSEVLRRVSERERERDMSKKSEQKTLHAVSPDKLQSVQKKTRNKQALK